MEVTVQTKLLQKAMARLQRICERHKLYIEAVDSQLVLKGEDNLLLCECRLPADVLTAGVFSTGWLGFLSLYPGRSTHLITCDQEQCLTLRSGSVSFTRLRTGSHSYPTIPKMKPVAEFGADLITALKKLKPFFVNRAFYPTLRLEGGRGEFTLMVTTQNLTYGWVKGVSGPEHRVKIEIPLELAIELIDAKPSRVLLLKGGKHIGASFGGVLIAKLAAINEQGSFHDPPQDLKTIASVWFDPEPLIKICRQAMKEPLIGSMVKRSNSPTFELSFKNGFARFCFTDDEGEIEMRGVSYAGELPSSVSLEPDPHILNRFLSNCESDLIRLDFLQHGKDDYLGLSDCSGYDYRFPY